MHCTISCRSCSGRPAQVRSAAGRWLGGLLALFAALSTTYAAEPLKLHPDNPHYLLFREKPMVLITSGEHYGAVLNRDFDYVAYLDELQKYQLNLTRTFSGTYREIPSSFGIVENTLSPKPDQFSCPWRRTASQGSPENGAKFDLNSYDADYFRRLHDFVRQAGERGIVVELVLFCTIYDDNLWDVNPMNPRNNVNELSPIARNEIYTLKDPKLVALQEALVRKIVTELKDYDNVYYEICNEPYFGGVSKEWNDRMASVIAETESAFPHRHLIAQNISNGSQKINDPHPAVSIFNFHYSTPPDSVAMNYGLNKVIGDDETGFRGKDDLPYRSEGWDFLIAGGAIYSNLDYSYSVSHPDGSATITTSPGGGGPALRKQLQILKQFIEGFGFVRMKPDSSVIQGGVPDKGSARALVEAGKAYAIYVRGGEQVDLVVQFPAGTYRAEWIDTKTGETAKAEVFSVEGNKTLNSPKYRDDIALRVVRQEK